MKKINYATNLMLNLSIKHTLIFTHKSRQKSDKVVADILENQNGESDRILSLELDTVDEKAIEQAVKQVVEKWGTIHVLVNAYVEQSEFNQVI